MAPKQSDVRPDNTQQSKIAWHAPWQELNTHVVDLLNQGKYLEAMPLARKSVELAKSSYGADDSRLATSLNLLGLLYKKQGKYDEAEPLYQQALDIRKKALRPDYPNIGTDLDNLASLYAAQGKYDVAEPLYRQALAIRMKWLGPNHPNVASSLNNLAGLYLELGKYSEAEPLYRQALEIWKKAAGSDHPLVATGLNNLAALYLKIGKYGEAEPLFKEALEMQTKALGPAHPEVATDLSNLALLYETQGMYGEAEPLFQQALEIQKKALGPAHPEVANSLNSLAGLFFEQGKYGEAEPIYQQALAIRKKTLGPDHPYVASSLDSLGSLYQAQGKYGEAEPIYQQALAIRKKALGADHPGVASSLNDLALLYYYQGRYLEAEPLYRQALAIDQKALGFDHPAVATNLHNLAALYLEQGRYAEAEPLDQKALAIRQRALGPNHPAVANSLNSLGSLYQAQGKYGEAERLYQRALAIRKKALGPDHPDLATNMSSLAELYREQGKYGKAEPLLKQALEIRTKTLGQDHALVADSLDNLAEIYLVQGKYGEAELFCKQALAIHQKTLGSDHPSVATSLNDLAVVYTLEGKYGEAEPLFQEALRTYRKALGPDHPSLALGWKDSAMLYDAWNHPQEAEANFDSAFQILHKVIEKQFAYMSENERLGFLGTVHGVFPLYSSFVSRRRDRKPSLVGALYDVLLWEKGMVASSVSAMRAKIAASGDREAVSLLDKIARNRTQVARIIANPPGEPKLREQAREQIAELEQQANDLERELVKRSPATAQQRSSAQANWEGVRAKLRAGEAAVEYVRYGFHDGNHWTGKSYYAALVITQETKIGPTFISLGNAATLECGPVNSYRQLVGMSANCLPCSVPPQVIQSSDVPTTATAAANTPTFYDAFWKPLEPALRNVKRIYLSTDGVLSQVSLAVVPDDSGKLLIEKYDLRPVISTKDLLSEPHAPGEQTAVLIGDPKFTATIAQQQTALVALSKPQSPEGLPSAGRIEVTSNGAPVQVRGSGRRSFDLQDLTWPDLPSTKIEVQQLNKLLTRPWHVEMYTEADALEEVMKRLRGPRLLHVATHGFFLADENQEQACSGGVSTRTAASANAPDTLQQRRLKEDPMLRSGLVFTGANRIANGEATPEGMDDGILTAYEAMGLNLEGTELVVLSACETGLGQTQAGEGVFGLRRALQVAGAQSVMMTMWEVPDVETQKLMKLFYGKWLSGEEKHQALREAQLELREQIKKDTGHDAPQKWGAFVLVGP